MLQLDWYKSADGSWCQLDKLELGLLHGFGVFVIWKNGNGAAVSAVLYVGHGSLRDEILRCRRDPLFHQSSELFVTWATISAQLIEPIAAYLYHRLRPLWGDAIPSAVPLMQVTVPIQCVG